MAYLGNPDLSIEAQERVMAAFRQVVANLQSSQREEAMIGLEFVLRIDPAFTPAVGLQQQLKSGSDEIDLSDLLGQLEAPTTDAINEMMVEAVEAFNQRNFVESKALVEKVLLELPGQQEARQLLGQLNDALKVEQQVGQFLAQAREALSSGDPQEAANFVTMAQALDPHHSGITATLQEIYAAGGAQQQTAPEPPPAGPFADPETPQESPGGFAIGPSEHEEAAPQFDAGPAQEIFFGSEPATPREGAAEAPPQPSDPEPEPLGEALNVAETAGAADDDVADLFDAGSDTLDGSAEGTSTAAAELIQRGTSAYETGQLLEAIDAWSRVYLDDPTNREVGPMIEAARSEFNELRRGVEQRLFDAEDAIISGDKDKALELVEQVLAEHPAQPDALELRQRLTVGAPRRADPAPVEPTTATMPDLEDDLFSEPFDSEAVDKDLQIEQEPADAADEFDDFADDFATPPSRKKLFGLSPRTLAIAVLAVAGLAVAGWLGSRLLLGGGGADEDAVYVMKDEADALFREGDVAGALDLVEGFAAQNEQDQQLVTMLATKYRAALATPTPTPVPATAIEARAMLAAGLWFRAYDIASKGLESHPGDPGLQEIVDQVEQQDARAATLRTQLLRGNHRAAAATASDLLEVYPGQRDLEDVLQRSLFNAALAELRTYNLTGASTHLNQLDAMRPDDEEVDRVLEFVRQYKARPVDMQLKVFIQSLSERHGWKDLSRPATINDGASATPTPEAPAT